MRKLVTYLILIVFVISVALAGCGSSSNTTSTSSSQQNTANTSEKKLPVIGVAIYKFDDTFMTSVRDNIAKAAEGKAKVDMVDSQNSQPVQNDKVDLFITKKVNALIINPVDRTAAGTIIDKAKQANIPVVFINREPLPDDLKKWDKVYYVGAKAEQSGTLQGEIMADYWKSHPEADKNHDGVMQYVMLMGEPGHQDAELRTKYSIEAVKEAGIKVQELAKDTAMWDRVKAQDKMAAFLAAYGDKIEAVFANNDDMALGAIEALKAAGYFKNGKYIPVVGVDATVPGIQALKEGTLLGTVLNDAKNQAKAAFMLAYVLAQGQTPTKENIGYDITDGKYVWIPYVKITLDNINDATQ
ncbi:galactose ABC transporter substrate-binding protein [Thermoanaerobacter sp. CM-CNRG TB177]|uniref:galactose ABC transporter substrate-binding protein n=1 Tax=Thermoanaerobacter sp. CM-CNRG TB177 TaxID=2800659 RepID=UPI001BDE5045|nr:galactose ABC transporter substrate-binding protein [Thermoanaerobacter sp. CM-CNRG TB177]MBT1278382.1 galactose/glucose ABC transporter substrate-binding protein MglB [Thermoanaerobacter sp. CM-CNRG TB177]